MESSLTFLSYFLHFTLNLRQIVAILPSRYTQNPTTFLLALTPPGCKSPSSHLLYCSSLPVILPDPACTSQVCYQHSIQSEHLKCKPDQVPSLLRMANASLCHSVETTVLKNGTQSLMPTAPLPNHSDHGSYYSSH